MSKEFQWTRAGNGDWTAHGYRITRDMPVSKWRILRDGAWFDSVRSLIDAKRIVEKDFAHRADVTRAPKCKPGSRGDNR